MFRLLQSKKGQNILEYATLILIITAALIAMYPYMSRAINARLKQIQVELDESKR